MPLLAQNSSEDENDLDGDLAKLPWSDNIHCLHGEDRKLFGSKRSITMRSSGNLEFLTNGRQSNRVSEAGSDLVIEDIGNDNAGFSPAPAYSDKFGKLKKSEALEIFFKTIHRQLRQMKVYFGSELDIISQIDANEQVDELSKQEFARYVEKRSALRDQFCELFKFDLSHQK